MTKNAMTRGARASASSRGYTIVELLMAVCVFGIGVMGIIAMQKVTVTSNRHAKNLAIGTHLAESWLEHLAVDATNWTQLQPTRAGTVWLDAEPGAWTRPAYVDAQDFGGAFDAQGTPLADTNAASAVYCAHVRLADLIPTPGYGLLRVDVRVFWPRDGETPHTNFCDGADPDDIGASPDRYHFVYKTTAVRQTSF